MHVYKIGSILKYKVYQDTVVFEYLLILITRPRCPIAACLQMVVPPFAALFSCSNVWNQTLCKCAPILCTEARD